MEQGRNEESRSAIIPKSTKRPKLALQRLGEQLRAQEAMNNGLESQEPEKPFIPKQREVRKNSPVPPPVRDEVERRGPDYLALFPDGHKQGFKRAAKQVEQPGRTEHGDAPKEFRNHHSTNPEAIAAELIGDPKALVPDTETREYMEAHDEMLGYGEEGRNKRILERIGRIISEKIRSTRIESPSEADK